jgi:hypothetical protein
MPDMLLNPILLVAGTGVLIVVALLSIAIAVRVLPVWWAFTRKPHELGTPHSLAPMQSPPDLTAVPPTSAEGARPFSLPAAKGFHRSQRLRS